MKIRWFGQSAFLLSGSVRVAIDPFGDVGDRLTARGLQFAYPRIEGVDADVRLITHEHFDHSAADAIGGDPETVRSTAGTFDTPVGEVRAIASEHDDAAGTQRGPNTIFAFALDGLRLCHFGDFGQASLRPEQRAAIVRELQPRLVIPMHYRTEAVNFLDSPDAFLAVCDGDVRSIDGPEAELEGLPGNGVSPVIGLLTPPA